MDTSDRMLASDLFQKGARAQRVEGNLVKAIEQYTKGITKVGLSEPRALAYRLRLAREAMMWDNLEDFMGDTRASIASFRFSDTCR